MESYGNTSSIQENYSERGLPKLPLEYPDDRQCKQTKLLQEVTIVTMYLNIGNFRKGEGSGYHSPDMYRKWMRLYGFLLNPVIAFFDNETDRKYFLKIRRLHGQRDHTKTFLLGRRDMWAFSLRANISRIFKKPGYPKHHPNTVIPDYSCATNAKYELIFNATNANWFCTRYFAWSDIGFFRNGEAQKKHVIL
ncbi:hypothetical protein LSH36_615g01074 [Paralvinella palmiformis]|uniref:Uncharacterized protein n=1 Tax=Paralvinella palmiformis TaxID=53620 RepID=A0AAD9MX86_9ANNE|nr:hypothetical protein LSH36_615g01074 [Paralvinella palmiformis]